MLLAAAAPRLNQRRRRNHGKVILFGANRHGGPGRFTRMSEGPAVEKVLTVGRMATWQVHPKLREIEMGGFSTSRVSNRS